MRGSMRKGRSGKFASALILVICLALAVLGLSGCRVSDALTEVIYDQTADIIDYDNPTKIYVNDSTAEDESDQFAAKEVSDDTSVVSDTVQNLVVYSSSPNTEGFTAKKSVFDKMPDFRGIEASEEVCFVKSSDPEAFDHPVTVEDPVIEEPDPEEDVEPIIVDSVTTAPSDTTTTTASDDSSTSKSDSNGADDTWEDVDTGDNNGEENVDTGDPEETDEGGGNDNGEVEVAYDATDPTAEPEKVSTMAAYGPAATIVAMIGGAGALVATDSDTLSGNFARVFDASGIVAGWSGDGEDASTMDVDAIIASGADTLLVYSGDYLRNGLSEADVKKLNKAGVKQTVIYSMKNSGNIKRDVKIVAEMLAESDKIAYAGQTTSRAADYVAFHDRVVQAAADANDGLAGEVVYETGNDSARPGLSSARPFYTLLVDAYEDAAYIGSTRNGWLPSSGLAYASAGYNATPVSYYIQAGGAVNNAAAQTSKSGTGKVVAWQFNVNNFQFKKRDWSGDIAQEASTPDGYSLLTTTNNLHSIYPFGESFGSASFPRLIATSSEIKARIVENSKSENGVYHPYGFTSNGVISMMGPDPSLPACIGFNGADASQTENLFEGGQIDEAAIVVNPRGLFSDWTQGTVESFLEAAWVSDVVVGIGPGTWAQEVAGFYAQFYGYSLTDADWVSINAGGN